MPETLTVEAVLLCIGPENGVTLLAPDEEEPTPETVYLGRPSSRKERQDVFELAQEYVEPPDAPLVIVAEEGEPWEAWRKVDGVAVQISFPVESDRWRKRMFGPRYPRSRERAKKKAQAYLLHALDLPHNPDVAETVCLGIWASKDETIRKHIEKIKEKS